MISRRSRTRRNALVVLLDTLPPIFHVALLSSLTYYTFTLHLTSAAWGLSTVFVVAQILLNWIQFLRHKSVVPTSTRNFPGYVHRFPSLTSSKDARVIDEEFEAMRSSWKECDSCDMHVPLVSHHCSHCRSCIYAKDHHCYFLGHCVGRANLKHFIVFCFWASVGSALGAYSVFTEMAGFRKVLSREFVYYLFPVTSVMWMVGSAERFEVVYVAMIDFAIGSTAFCGFFFFYAMRNVIRGDPRHERAVENARKKQPVSYEFTHVVRIRYDDEREMTNYERFSNVFGSCGIFHFIFPFAPFSQDPVLEPGYRRIVTFDNDFVMDGMVHTSETLLT